MGNNLSLKVNIGNLELKNPVMTASGTFGYGLEFSKFIDLEQLGAIVTKGLSLKPSKGNPPVRVVETKAGMLNAIGLENIGFDLFVKEKVPYLAKLNVPTIVNIYGKTIDEYGLLAQKFDDIKEVSAIEVNISCPNVSKGGVAFGTDPKIASKLVENVRKKTKKTLIVKLTPNVTDITQIAKCVEDSGADSISLINTITGMAIDIKKKTPILKNITGGLSGPAIKPIALRMVWQVVNNVKIPVIGIGGIMEAKDAIEFLIVGATAVQVGTANLINPNSSIDIINGIKKYMDENDIYDIYDLINSIKY